ncbi:MULTISPECIES: hypothetical protein [unclassified Streptomyces]|uniref:rhamnogalacturonan endolyase family protein n=1 Tax=unclassified Streptomyces TaxID=2593676 RepID=UPI00338D9F88
MIGTLRSCGTGARGIDTGRVWLHSDLRKRFLLLRRQHGGRRRHRREHAIAFNVYRDGRPLDHTPGTRSTTCRDDSRGTGTCTVRAVVNGHDRKPSSAALDCAKGHRADEDLYPHARPEPRTPPRPDRARLSPVDVHGLLPGHRDPAGADARHHHHRSHGRNHP